MSKREKVTQSDVARTAGVSQGIVSSILSGRSNESLSVSEATRRRVIEVASQLGYVARASGRRRSTGPTSNQVLLVMPPTHRDAREGALDAVSTSYRSLMGRAVSELGALLAEHGLGLSVHQLSSEKGLMQWLAESDVCAVIWHTTVGSDSILNWVAARFPVVLMNQMRDMSIQTIDDVSVNQSLNVTMALEHLWRHGHRQIAYFGHVPGSTLFAKRLSAYHAFVAEKGIRNFEAFQRISDAQKRPYTEKVSEILDTWESLGEAAPTALVLGDIFALRVMDAANKRGIRIPEDLSLVGIDNLDACEFVTPRLSSIEQSFTSLSEEVVERLMRRIKRPDAPTQSITIAPHLIERESVKTLTVDVPEVSAPTMPVE